MTTLTCNTAHLEARIFHGLKSLFNLEDTLPPRYLEYAICQCFGLKHVGDGNFYADGYVDNIQASIKTRMFNPDILKTQKGRDFQTHPDKFLGPHQNVKQNKWTAGVEIVQRRQALDFDDITADATQVGIETLKGFHSNINESHRKYNTDITYEIISTHGYNHNRTCYIMNVYWQEYQLLDPVGINWIREGYGVSGYITVEQNLHKIVERVNGNAKREATCFKEFKNLTKYKHSVSIEVPIPEQWNFNQEKILTEIQHLKGNTHVDSLFISE
jgi:hypothetical protein